MTGRDPLKENHSEGERNKPVAKIGTQLKLPKAPNEGIATDKDTTMATNHDKVGAINNSSLRIDIFGNSHKAIVFEDVQNHYKPKPGYSYYSCYSDQSKEKEYEYYAYFSSQEWKRTSMTSRPSPGC